MILSGGEEGKLDLALDSIGVGFLKYANTAKGLAKTFWYGTDSAVNGGVALSKEMPAMNEGRVCVPLAVALGRQCLRTT